LDAGMWDHIGKPLNVQAMFNTMAKWIKPGSRPGTSVVIPNVPVPEQAGGVSTVVAMNSIDTSDSSLNYAENTPAIDAASAPADTALAEAFDRLTVLLQDSDADAADLLDNIAQLVEGTPLAVSLKPVSRAVESFDFDAALSALKAIRPY